MINFRGIKSGHVTFLGFLSLKTYLTIEKTTQDKKRRVRRLLVSKGAQARRRVLMMGKVHRRISVMGNPRRREGTQGAQFIRLKNN